MAFLQSTIRVQCFEDHDFSSQEQRPWSRELHQLSGLVLGSPTRVKELDRPVISSAAGRQVSAPAPGDVTRFQQDNETEESSDADGWDDAWDDEERWGDMEVTSLLSCLKIIYTLYLKQNSLFYF